MTEPLGEHHAENRPSGVRSSPASAYAVALLAELAQLGVTDVVVAPGSRSQALALAAAEFERVGRLRLHVRIDERSAGFLALGLAVETGRPAVVVATSGTAIANLHPAVLEAHHSGVPMIVVSADRPAELRGIRSNQTTMQPGIFAGAVRLERDLAAPEGAPGEVDASAAVARDGYAAAMGVDVLGAPIPHPGPGPVHLNLQLREPLSAAGVLPEASTSSVAAAALTAAIAANDATPAGAAIAPGPRTLVVAGAGAGAGAEAFARAGGWPLAAEVTSGAHFGPNLVVAYRELLNEPGFGDRVERVIVFGHPTLTREVPALVQRDDVETIAVAPNGIEWFNPGHRVRRFERAVHAAPAVGEVGGEQREWLTRWVRASRILGEVGAPAEPAAVRSGVDETGHVTDFAAQRVFLDAQLARVREPVTRRMLVEQVWAASWPHDRLVFGASRLIREADRVVPGRRIHAHANRGLAGIDGTVATAMGIAVASQAAVVVEAAPGVASGGGAGAGAGGAGTGGAGADAGGAVLGATDLASMLAEAAAAEEAVEAARAVAASARAASEAESSTTRALIGDLTLLHDVGSMLIGAGEVRPRLLAIVGNDGGGTIFDSLEVAASAPVDAFDRVQYTPQSVDFEALARAYDWHYLSAATRGELEAALSTSITGPTLLEVRLAR